ncbi:DUF4145 domain-containing protein [Xanthomonas citri]|nr:DUF4145 domain-containing protein [Xanthomonas citri]
MTMTSEATRAVTQSTSTSMFSCGACSGILCVHYRHNGRDSWVEQRGDFEEGLSYNDGQILRRYPEAEAPACPANVSENVRRAYLQGCDNAARGNRDAAAAMFRKALDVSTKELDPQSANRNLKPRIDALYQSGKLTADLKDWAHLIRLDGNEGAHDEDELTGEQIEQLESFTELFLIYTFTLPAEVSRRKEQAQPGNS